MALIQSMQKYGLERMLDYIYKEPEFHLRNAMDWVDRFAGKEFGPQRRKPLP